jgi:hypothetical protein
MAAAELAQVTGGTMVEYPIAYVVVELLRLVSESGTTQP